MSKSEIVSSYYGMSQREYKAFKLRHKLICQSIKEKSDFDLDKINKEVEKILRSEEDESDVDSGSLLI